MTRQSVIIVAGSDLRSWGSVGQQRKWSAGAEPLPWWTASSRVDVKPQI